MQTFTALTMSDEADIEKKVAPLSCAIAFPMRVFPVPITNEGDLNKIISTKGEEAYLYLAGQREGGPLARTEAP